MTTYIAFLRGINVGGKTAVKMADLKQVFEAAGLDKVQTYINSGNVLFQYDREEGTLRDMIESEISSFFHLSIAVAVRSASDLEGIIRNLPFSKEEIAEAESHSDNESLYVALLSQPPLPDKVESWSSFKSEKDEYKIIGREVYLLFRDSVRTSKLANKLGKLDAAATVRNWNTMNKLSELAHGMDAP